MQADPQTLVQVTVPSRPAGPRHQLPPVFYAPDGNPLFLADDYRGCTAFLICGGPSLLSHDLTQLTQRGMLTCSVNNAAAVVPTRLWVGVDPPKSFCGGIWQDPCLQKFVPLRYLQSTIRVRDDQGQLIDSSQKVCDMPAVRGIRLSNGFCPDRFLTEPTFTWGNEGQQTDDHGNAGVRSVMLVALKLLYVLGVRRVFLLGCDFRMRYGVPNYAFAQHRTRAAVRANNRTYRVLAVRLADLQPWFLEAGYMVYNCTPQSDLFVFPHVDYAEAIASVTTPILRSLRTDDMYDPPTAPDNV
jgi:hypothetical protein